MEEWSQCWALEAFWRAWRSAAESAEYAGASLRSPSRLKTEAAWRASPWAFKLSMSWSRSSSFCCGGSAAQAAFVAATRSTTAEMSLFSILNVFAKKKLLLLARKPQTRERARPRCETCTKPPSSDTRAESGLQKPQRTYKLLLAQEGSRIAQVAAEEVAN